MKVTMPWSWAVQNSLNLNGVKIESSSPFYYGIVSIEAQSAVPFFRFPVLGNLLFIIDKYFL